MSAAHPRRCADLRPTGFQAGEAESTWPGDGPVPGVIVGLRRGR